MRNWVIKYWLLFFLVGCISPFEFESGIVEGNLVVEAILTDKEDFNYVKLNYSHSLDDTASNPIVNAQVLVLSSSGEEVNYHQEMMGTYWPPDGFVGKVNVSYQLFIVIEGKTYYTKPVTMIKAPDIDIHGQFKTVADEDLGRNVNGVQFFVDSDLAEDGEYFRYEWEDTYKVVVPYPKNYTVTDGELIEINSSLGECYATTHSQSILIKDVVQQTEKVIKDFPVRFMREGQQAYRQRYSILVRQYSLSYEVYDYFKKLKKNNEGGGSLFDQQNGSIIGNILSDNNETVLGIFQVSSVNEVRRFYYLRDFGRLRVPGFRPNCPEPEELLTVSDLAEADRLEEYGYGIYTVTQVGPFSYVYSMSFGACSNCSSQGAIVKPDWWED